MSQSNFSFLTGEWAFLASDSSAVEKYALSDPRAAAIFSRRSIELGLKWIFANDPDLYDERPPPLAGMIAELGRASFAGRGLEQDLRYIQRLGNVAVHEDQEISTSESLGTARALHSVLRWMVRVYDGDKAPDIPSFQQTLIPSGQGHASEAQIKELAARAEEASKVVSAKDLEIEELKAKLAAMKAVKEANTAKIGSDEYSEAETRELIIDVMLREAGWDPKGKDVEEYEVKGMPTKSGERTGTGFVDYVLWGKDGKPVGLVEAKRTRVNPKQGERQAELYADCLEAKFGQRPIIYYSNGYKTWIWDDSFYPPREVQGFGKQDELQWLVNQRTGRQDLSTIKPKTEIADRHYHFEAQARVMEAFGEQRRRKALIVMATGTGKTRLSISMVDMLMRAGWARRVLFLADRISLVNQAKRNFNALLPHVNVASLLDDPEGDARILFSTYPTMMNCIDGTRKGQKGLFGANHFDLIIIDEAHRSVYQKYGAIFDYFDSLLIGLTATPRGDVGRDTYNLFDLQKDQPTFAYELEQAIADGFLVPPRAISVPLKFQREGIKYDELPPEEQEEYEATEAFYDEETGELIEAIEPAALNKWLFNEDTVDKVLAHLMENGIKVEGGDKLGKTIVFAKNAKHAEFIVGRFDKNYPALAGKFCRQVDYSVKYVQSLIDDFSIKTKDPQIAVSVDMLDTGIDVPEVVNLVFFKMIRSKIKFWQMIGRGTRLCPDLFMPGEDKSEFAVFDYCQNFEFFNANPDGYEGAVQESVKQKIFKRRIDLIGALDNAKQEADFSSTLKDQLRAIVSSYDLDNFIVRKKRQQIETYVSREKWDELADTDLAVLSDHLSGLPSHDEDDEFARRFDLLILNLQLAILQKNKAQVKYMASVRKLASQLELKATIPAVNAQMETILEVQEDAWWQDVTLPMLEKLRVKLRDLMKFVDRDTGLTDVFTNFEDELGEPTSDIELVKADANLLDYRKRVMRFLTENSDHLTIRRLKNNEPVSAADIVALEEILFSADGPLSKEQYQEIYGERPLGQLVRSILGLNRRAAKEALADFLSRSSLLPDQISFLDQVVDYLVKNGTMEPKTLFETPFTHVHHEGLTGIFDNDDSDNVVRLIRQVNANAESADERSSTA